jgi:hypothetical protein
MESKKEGYEEFLADPQSRLDFFQSRDKRSLFVKMRRLWRWRVVAMGLALTLILPQVIHYKNSLLEQSHCSKVRQGIRAEESIGKLLWLDYSNIWVRHIASPSESSLFNPVVNSLMDVFQSDKIVYDLAKRNTDCFTFAKNAWVRTESTKNNLFIKNLRTWINSRTIFANNCYPEYASFFDISTSVPAPTPKVTQL